MGSYYNVEKVQERARRVKDFIPHDPKQPSVRSGQRLIAVLDARWRKLAVDVTRPKEWQEFYGQYASGHFLKIFVYTYPELDRESLR